MTQNYYNTHVCTRVSLSKTKRDRKSKIMHPIALKREIFFLFLITCDLVLHKLGISERSDQCTNFCNEMNETGVP